MLWGPHRRGDGLARLLPLVRVNSLPHCGGHCLRRARVVAATRWAQGGEGLKTVLGSKNVHRLVGSSAIFLQKGKLSLKGGRTSLQVHMPQTLRAAGPPETLSSSTEVSEAVRLRGGEWGTSRSKVRSRWGGMELEPRREPPRAPPTRAGPGHYLIAASAHWLVPPEAGPLRRSALTLPAPWAQPWPCHLSPRPHAASEVHGPRRGERYFGGGGGR